MFGCSRERGKDRNAKRKNVSLTSAFAAQRSIYPKKWIFPLKEMSHHNGNDNYIFIPQSAHSLDRISQSAAESGGINNRRPTEASPESCPNGSQSHRCRLENKIIYFLRSFRIMLFVRRSERSLDGARDRLGARRFRRKSDFFPVRPFVFARSLLCALLRAKQFASRSSRAIKRRRDRPAKYKINRFAIISRILCDIFPSVVLRRALAFVSIARTMHHSAAKPKM